MASGLRSTLGPSSTIDNAVLFSSKANSGGEQDNRSLYRAVTCTLTMIAPPLTPYFFLLRIIIITNYYLDIPTRFGQAVTIGRHDRDCYVQFEYSCKQLYHVEKFFKIIIGPEERWTGLVTVTSDVLTVLL